MAERGGYRRPSEQQSFSGVGKNSRRTDKQIKRSPNVQDSTDLQVGDRKKIEQMQDAAPLGRAPSPGVSAAPPRGGSPSPTAGGGAVLPEHVFALPADSPMEQGMAPQPIPQEPEDDMEVVLQFLVDNFQDQAAFNMLNEHRQSKVQVQPAPMPEPMPMDDMEAPEPSDPEPIELGADLATEDEVAGEEVDQTSVETPATSSETQLV